MTQPAAHAPAGFDAGARPLLGKLFRLQWEEAQQSFVLLYPEGMVKLNRSAAEILQRCNGTLDVDAIVADLERTFSTAGLRGEVLAFLDIARRQGWVKAEPA